MKLFVPGRICLFGEHSDWAGGYRRINADIHPGRAVITGTNQGLYAEVKPHPSKLIIRTTLENGSRLPPSEFPMERDALLAAAGEGGFFSYAAGVAYQVLTHSRVHGLEIDNYRTTLPIRKGLSSSAAICVLVARAFNRLYDLKLTVRGEMELAYSGEITTPSRCGRLDQGCAYGHRPILMNFDGDRIDIKELNVATDLHLVIVDLQAEKDTREILKRLNACYPFADGAQQEQVQQYLGPINAEIVEQAGRALAQGDARALGELMTRAQRLFDRHLQPACPGELTAPVLHSLLNEPRIQPWIFGGKGVGSQGDGSAQLVARNAESQQQLIRFIEEELQMPCLELVISPARGVRKAVIPAAGFGTRLFPATKAVKKELFPIIDAQGRAKPVILAIVEEAISAGIEEICILVQQSDLVRFEEIFHTPPPIENFNKLSGENQQYCEYLMELGHHVRFLPQTVQDGFGHAVYCAREWVGNEPFLLLLGDHLYAAAGEQTCAAQLVAAFEQTGISVVGLKPTPAEKIHLFGTAAGTPRLSRNQDAAPELLDITALVEKPTRDYAAEHLQIPELPENQFLGFFGQYVLTPRIFEFLEENIRHNLRENGEFQLTSALENLRREDGAIGQIVDGERFDIGNPEAYLQALNAFHSPR